MVITFISFQQKSPLKSPKKSPAKSPIISVVPVVSPVNKPITTGLPVPASVQSLPQLETISPPTQSMYIMYLRLC